MKRMSFAEIRWAALLALLLVDGARLCAAEDGLVGRRWQLVKPDAGQATLTTTADGLSVELKGDGKPIVHVTCDPPVALPAGAKRLALWADPAAMGSAFAWKVLTASIHAQVRDAQGVLHRFPFCAGSLSNRGWGRLTTEDLSLRPYAQPWENHPKEPLTLVGLDIKPGAAGVKRFALHGVDAETEARIPPAMPWEIVSLTDPSERETWYNWTGCGIEYDAEGWEGVPFLTRDALVDRPGEYVIGIKLRDGWQGAVKREWQQRVTVPAANPEEGRREPFFLPAPQPGTYFVEARIRSPDTTLQATKHFLLYANGPAGTDGEHRDGPGGFLDLRTAPAQHVFAAGQAISFRLQVRVPPLPGEKSVHVLLTDYQYRALKEETLDVPAAASSNWETRIEFPARAAEACRAVVELRVAGKLVDRDSLILGRPAAPRANAPADRPTVRRTARGEERGSGATASAFLVYAVPPTGLDSLARVGRGMDQAVLNGNRFVEIQMLWQDLEPLPGLYQFSLLDQILDLAETKGLEVKIAPWYLGDHAPRWLFPHPARYEDGSSTFIGGSHFTPSASNPVVQQAIVRLWQVIARRYRHHPALAGYLVVGPSLDLGYWHNGLLHDTDYSPTAAASYRHYLRSVCRYSLAQVSSRYGRRFGSWEEVLPPQKDWGGEVDLRPQWVDFLRYQQWELAQWMERNFRAIRQEDPVHTVTQYQWVGYGPQEYYYPLFRKYRVEATTGGSEAPIYQRFVSAYHLWGLRSRGGETIQTVERWNLYRSLFNMLAYGGDGAYYAVQWHNVYPEPWDTEPGGPAHLQRWSAVKGVGGWLARVKGINFSPDYAKWSKILEELGNTQPMPLEAGSLSSYDNCLYRMRSLLPYWVSSPGVTKAWMEKEHRLPLWITESTPLELFRHLKVLVADADIPVMSRATAQNLTAYVKAGGCLVTFAATGKYTVETGKPDFGFLAGLGFSTPAPPQGGSSVFSAKGSSFLDGEALVLKELWAVQAPPGTEVLARLPDGTPCALRRRLGAGEIILFLGELDWEQSGHVLGAVCRHRHVTQWCDVTDPRIRAYALQRGETRYVLAYYHLDQRQNAAAGKQSARATVKVHRLAAPAYHVTELGQDQTLGDLTTQQLESGLEADFQAGELKVFRCVPARGGPVSTGSGA